MNWSSSGWDAFTISAPVLHKIRPVTHRSVDRATTKRTTEPIQRTEATEKVIRFHSEGILRAHGAPGEVTRRRAATAERTRQSPWAYALDWVRKINHNRRQTISLGKNVACVDVWVTAEEKLNLWWSKGSVTGRNSIPALCAWVLLHLCVSVCLCHTHTHTLSSLFSRSINFCHLAFGAGNVSTITGDLRKATAIKSCQHG